MENLLDNIILITPTDNNGVPLYDGWLIQQDLISRTFEWRNHWRVKKLKNKEKKEIENAFLEKNKDYAWVKEYEIIDDVTNETHIIKATDEIEARSIFRQLGATFTKIYSE